MCSSDLPTEVPQEAFLAAKSFFESFSKGEIKTSAAPADEQAPAKQARTEEEVPF